MIFTEQNALLIVIIGFLVWIIGYAMQQEPNMTKLGSVVRLAGVATVVVGVLILLVALIA
jgi:vacuolar-type H+-ATPase subunit I/STV1